MGLILGCGEKEKRSNSLIIDLLERLSSGERGIRTPGTFQCGSFQDCCNRPLYHLSKKSGAGEAMKWCHQESNRGHKDFQSFALPTELWHLGKDCHALHTPAYNAALAK